MTETGASAAVLAGQVRRYLRSTPRQLPSSAMYDTLGSVLFEAICLLPWYPITRAERRLIADSRDLILAAAQRPTRLLELGCGNGRKLDLLLGEGASAVGRIDLVDVSALALVEATRVLTERRAVSVATYRARYEDGLARALADREDDDRVCVLFLGSNIGNFDPDAAQALLRTIRGFLRAGDTLLVGWDLVKPEPDLLLAYDDPLGVTAAFNKNLLVRLNRELGATFDISRFGHRAVWNAAASRVEMHLVSRMAQRVTVPGADLDIALEEGETIWTESSYKFTEASVTMMLEGARFSLEQQWMDLEGLFLLTMASVGPRFAPLSMPPTTTDVGQEWPPS